MASIDDVRERARRGKPESTEEAVKKVLTDCGSSTQTLVYRKAASLEVELLDVIKAAGVQVNNADNAAFVKASKAVYDEFSSSVKGGAELVKTVQSLSN